MPEEKRQKLAETDKGSYYNQQKQKNKGAFYNGIEAPTGGVLYSYKFCKFQREPSLMKSPFIKVAGLSSATLLITDSSTGFFL